LRRASFALAILTVMGALVLALLAWRVHLDGPELERRLLALDRNALVAQHGLSRRTLDLGVEGLADPATITYLHTPAPFEGAPIVVLLHGTPSSLFSWGELVLGDGGLARHAEVFALELLDHGLGPYAEGPASFQRCADFVSAVLESWDVPPVLLVGQSYGGEVAWRAALDRPDLIGRLVIMDGSGVPRPDDGWLPEELTMREVPGAGLGWILNARERIATALAPHVAEPLDPDLQEEVFLLCSRPPAWRAMVDLVRDENGQRFPELADLSQPTLLLWGGDDLAYAPDAYARAFEELIPDAQIVALPGVGHYPHEDAPERVAQELRAFLASP
jgi:pimeloyl-ACP methyl ester carboxylesterase